MDFEYSVHWVKKRKKRKDITDDMLEIVILDSRIIRDEHRENTFNAISIIPYTGRTLKVVYRKSSRKIFIITAYWLN